MENSSPWMALALEEARRAGTVSPNPAVGAVLVRDGALVGSGRTRPPGGAHAEVLALRHAAERARGASLVVTLEPCCHWGRTPPCADALLAAGVAEVHCALLDPDPRVRGRGVDRLRAAGVRVTVGDGAGEAARLLAPYLTQRITGRPHVTAKFAASLDGRIATRTGDAKWISGAEALARTRMERSAYDAILVGIGTILADDPQLTARRSDGEPCGRQPLRVALDASGRTPAHAQVLGPGAPTLIASTSAASPAWIEAMRERGAEVLILPGDHTGVHLGALLDTLGGRELLSLLVEGGATVHGSFFDGGHVDAVQAILAPLVIGGGHAPGAVGGAGPARLADAPRLLDAEVEQLGPDVMVRGLLRQPPVWRDEG